jgi:hypothetical protein
VADSKKVVEICTQYAQKGMLNIFLAVFFATLAFAFLEPFFFIGYLISIALFGLYQAIFMANAGGAWDNAKKIVETELKRQGHAAARRLRGGRYGGRSVQGHVSVALNPIIKFTTLFGCWRYRWPWTLTKTQGTFLTTALSAVFFLISVVFVYRSFYGMRIESRLVQQRWLYRWYFRKSTGALRLRLNRLMYGTPGEVSADELAKVPMVDRISGRRRRFHPPLRDSCRYGSGWAHAPNAQALAVGSDNQGSDVPGDSGCGRHCPVLVLDVPARMAPGDRCTKPLDTAFFSPHAPVDARAPRPVLCALLCCAAGEKISHRSAAPLLVRRGAGGTLCSLGALVSPSARWRFLCNRHAAGAPSGSLRFPSAPLDRASGCGPRIDWSLGYALPGGARNLLGGCYRSRQDGGRRRLNGDIEDRPRCPDLASRERKGKRPGSLAQIQCRLVR